MKKNMGNADRIIRVLLALVFAFIYFNGILTGIAGLVLLVLGVVFLLTSFMGFCPLYVPFGLSTSSAKKQEQ